MNHFYIWKLQFTALMRSISHSGHMSTKIPGTKNILLHPSAKHWEAPLLTSATFSARPSPRHRSACWLSQLPPFVYQPHVWVCNAVSLLAGSKQEQRKEKLVLLQRSNVLLVLLTTHGANVLLTRLFKCTHAISFPVWALQHHGILLAQVQLSLPGFVWKAKDISISYPITKINIIASHVLYMPLFLNKTMKDL